jgi:hypothetical protein
MKKEVNYKGFRLVKNDTEYYINDFPSFPNQTKKSKETFQSLERIILKEKDISYPLKFNITERVVKLSIDTEEIFSFSGIKKLIDDDKRLFMSNKTFFKLKVSFVSNNLELKIIYYTIDNENGLIDCKSLEMMLNIIFINYNIKQFTSNRVEVLTNYYDLNIHEIRQIPLIPLQWLEFDNNGNLLDFPNFKLVD